MEKVALYLRKSREDDRNESREETLARHERMLKDYCSLNHLIIDKIYKEVVSGNQISTRPKMQELMDDVYAKKYDGVVVVELSRLSRGDVVDQRDIFECFKKTNTKIYTLTKIYDFKDNENADDFYSDIDEDIYRFQMFFSDFEYRTIVRRLTRGRHQAQREGYFIGSNISFGYKKEKIGRGYVLVPDENAYLIKEIFHKYVYENLSVNQIRRWLNTLHIKSDSQKSDVWDNSRIHRILKNKTYLGLIRSQTSTSSTTKYYQGKHQALIDEETFNKASEIMASHHHIPLVNPGKKLVNPFAGIIKCSICSKAMYARYIAYGTNKKNLYLECNSPDCICVSVSLLDLETKFIQVLRDKLKENILYIEDEYINAKKNEIDQAINYRKDDLRIKKKMLDKTYENFEKGLYDEPVFLLRKETLENQILIDEERLKELSSSSLSNEYEYNKKLINVLRLIIYKYNKLKTAKYKNELLIKYIDEIKFKKLIKNKNQQINKLDNIELDIAFNKDEIIKNNETM